jgi:peptidoglycan hydrolase-like protein with peptidoglycan-binding domain
MKKGMSGPDVKTASDYLIKLGYLEHSKTKRNTDGTVAFDDNFEEAVKAYQRDKELLEDGELAKGTATYLAEDAGRYRSLGSRDLTVGMSGTDVTEMKNLLIDKGYSRVKKKGKYDVTTFDSSLLEVLQLFLDDIGLEWEGKVDSDMVRFLKKKYDD